MSVSVLRGGLPKAPHELQDEVELYARESGRTATLHFFMGCGWFVRFSLRCNDKRMLAFQQGMAAEPPTEDVFFHVPNPKEHDGLSLSELKAMDIPVLWSVVGFDKHKRCRMPFIPLDIQQMGPSGIRQFLEKGNMWSGRGEFDSLTEQLRKAREKNKAVREKRKEDARQEARKFARDQRGRRFKVPTVPVLMDFGRKAAGLITARRDRSHETET